jgi:formylglycine-generating enzyme required for sulfatase activity
MIDFLRRMAAPVFCLVLIAPVALAASAPPATCCMKLPSRFGATATVTQTSASAQTSSSTAGMAWIPGGEFTMGSSDPDAHPDEQPPHRVRLHGFWIDRTTVTNAQFRRFVEATHYVTTAERAPVLADIMKELPPGTPPPSPDKLVASSLVFQKTGQPVDLNDYSQWWVWVKGADWKHPEGPDTSIKGKDNYPVVQVSHDDAVAYAKWAGKRLPTEAEWEYAARAGLNQKRYAWGDAPLHDGKVWHANTWQGVFPVNDDGSDGFAGLAPVKSFPPNGYGLYDMSGNVWQWVADWYRPDTYQDEAAKPPVVDPTGPTSSYDPDEPTAPKYVMRGGSFLCNDSYCSGFRVGARMKSTPDTSTNHVGFRCVSDAPAPVAMK